MTYKKILAPAGKQQRPTITSLGFKEGTELIILSIDDYKRLNLEDNKELLDTIDNQKEIILNLENEKQELLKDKDEKEKTINNLIENNNNLNNELQANKINKNKLDALEKELILLKDNLNDKLNNLVLSNENTAKDLLTSLDNEYKTAIKGRNFIVRALINTIPLDIDLTKYKKELSQSYNNELENTKNKLLIASENIEAVNSNGVIAPRQED